MLDEDQVTALNLAKNGYNPLEVLLLVNYIILMTDVSEDSVENILKSLIDTCEGYIETFEFVIDLFLKVNLSQFRRDYLSHLKNEKTKALRKKVMEKYKKQWKQFDMKFCREDKSSGKCVSHLRLKSELTQNVHFLADKFTKKELLVLCTAYELTVEQYHKLGHLIFF